MMTKGIKMHCHFLYILLQVCLNQGCSSGKHPASSKTVITIATLNGPSAISMVQMMQDSVLSDSAILNFTVKSEPNLIKPIILQEQADMAIFANEHGFYIVQHGS